MKTEWRRSACALTVIGMLLAALTAMSLLPLSVLAADGASDTFLTAADASHWGRSDLRSYLNGVEKVSGTLPFDTDHGERRETGYYESQLSDAEYALVRPYTYTVNDAGGGQSGVYAVTDRFWLPGGNYYSRDRILSWGAEDISADDHAANVTLDRVIPLPYWTNGVAWLRGGFDSGRALASRRGACTISDSVWYSNAVAAAFKIDMTTVSFASVASAAMLTAAGGAQMGGILGASDFAEGTSEALPDYGMYLKTANSRDSFSVSDLQLFNDELIIQYNGGVAGQYVVVQAFEEDDLYAGTTTYMAAARLEGDEIRVKIDVSTWRVRSLDGFTVKVWMEDAAAGASLAPATMPITFVGNGGSFVNIEAGAIENPRVFAMKADLQTSWGALTSAGDEVGDAPTNQKIYFGTDAFGKPLQFWIAGRESYAAGSSPRDGDGTISKTGGIMTLYQAKSAESKAFSESAEPHKAVPMLILDEMPDAVYSGTAVAAPDCSYTFGGTDAGTPVMSYQHRIKDTDAAWTAGLPVNAGSYEVRGIAAATETYESVTSESVSVTIVPGVVIVTPDVVFACLGETPVLTYTASGFFGEDGFLVAPALTVEGDASGIGEYTVTASNADVGSNYTVTYRSGVLHVRDHLWNEGEIESEPGCTQPGILRYTCGHDNAHSYTEALEAKDHVYDNACDGDCNACGAARVPAEHMDANDDRICDACSTSLRQGLPTGAVVGIVIGAAVLLGGGGFAVYWLVIRRRRK